MYIPDRPDIRDIGTQLTIHLDSATISRLYSGGGYIGLEFASMFAGFGSKVTILEAGEVFIPREDRDIADSVKSTLEKKGITIHLNTVVQTIEQDVERAAVICRNAISGDTLRLEAEAVLLATGRKPNTESLNLQAAVIPIR